MADQSGDPLRDAAPRYADVEARRARAGVAAALFGGGEAAEPEPILVGRYRVTSRLGAGGMGVVYRAHDPDLDRPVAVKLLHASAADDDKARERMLREARSLAKLSHPNVITVYDVGVEDGQVFVAMELVAGEDLRRWLEPRGSAQWRETLDLFLAAGRGLEAAHAVGLVHRDFKPENVLVGTDGRVRVLDFGLARVRATIEPGPLIGWAPEQDSRLESQREAQLGASITGTGETLEVGAHLSTDASVGHLTETGALIGTPLYMAAELYAGQPASAASDQFAFCASLYEGLYHRRPFGEETIVAHVQAVRAGRLLDPPADSPVPVALWAPIARGLSLDPAARYEDMPALLAALTEVVAVLSGSQEQAGSLSNSKLGSTAGEHAQRGGPRWLPAVVVGVVLLAGVLGAFELGMFTRDSAASTGPETETARSLAPEGSAGGGDGARSVDGADSRVGGGLAGPSASSVLSDLEDGTGAEGETEGGTLETTDVGGEAPAEIEGGSKPSGSGTPESELHGWCHLHEDRYTLLSRVARRKGSLTHRGTCYVCRVERRRSRTRNFSPRDCAGYSLCGPSKLGDCE